MKNDGAFVEAIVLQIIQWKHLKESGRGLIKVTFPQFPSGNEESFETSQLSLARATTEMVTTLTNAYKLCTENLKGGNHLEYSGADCGEYRNVLFMYALSF
jgi:hypothetical protein